MKIVSSELQLPARRGRTEAVILFVVAWQTFAIAASAIDEIRSTDSFSLTASEITLKSVSKVKHRLRRGAKWYYVVNACAHFELPVSPPTLVLVLRNSRIAVLVDQIDRIETISRLMVIPRCFSGPELLWYRGLTLIDGNVIPVVNPSGFLTENEIMQLDVLDSSASVPVQSEITSRRSDTHGVSP